MALGNAMECNSGWYAWRASRRLSELSAALDKGSNMREGT